MDTNLSKYCMDIDFDLSFKQRPHNLVEMRKGTDQLISMLDGELSKIERAKLLTITGTYLRVLEDLEQSCQYLEEAYEILKQEKSLLDLIRACIELGTTYIYMNNYTKGDKILLKTQRAASTIKKKDIYKLEGDLLFALGLSKYWQGIKHEAQTYFHQSLEKRVNVESMKVIDFTKDALVRVSN